MDNLRIRARIAAKTDTKNIMERLWEGIENLNDEQKFSRDTYLEFKERIGSKISECQKSIQEAEKLLSA